jgi:hypothetical protein
VSEAVGELRLAEQAFMRPTLRLLNGKWAPVQLSVLRLVFDRDRRSVPTDRFHADVVEILAILRGEGVVAPNSSIVALFAHVDEAHLDGSAAATGGQLTKAA